MKRCFGYVRVSTLKQGDGVSLDAQRDAILAYAARNQIIIAKWFEERVTAAKTGRPAFNQMVHQLKRGVAQGLVIHKIDRSARNFADWAKVGELADAGIDVYFATETLDFRSRGGRLSADIQAVIAADYIRNLRDEVMKGMRGRLKQGLYPWAAPVGYLNNGKGRAKTIDQIKGPLVRELFELYASGTHSMRTLRIAMAQRGLCNTGGRPITKIGIEVILSNPFYTGIIRVRKTGETYKGSHEPLIDVGLYERVQKIKASRSGKKVMKHGHVFAGMFRCGGCQTAMIPERQKGHVYYRCHTVSCETKCVREEVIDTAVRSALQLAVSPETATSISQNLSEWMSGRTARLAARTNLLMAQIDRRLSKLADAYVDGLISEQLFAQKQQELLLQKESSRERQNTDRPRPTAADMRNFLELAKDVGRLYESADRDERRQIVDATTSNRTVSGKSLSVEPQPWLVETSSSVAVLSSALHRTTNRTSKQSITSTPRVRRAAKQLVEASQDANVKVLLELKRQREIDQKVEQLSGWRMAA
jgi:site-specific DNA recombinase